MQTTKDTNDTKTTATISVSWDCWLRDCLSRLQPSPDQTANYLVIGGFAAIAVGVGMIYLPAGTIVAGMLAVYLAKLMQVTKE